MIDRGTTPTTAARLHARLDGLAQLQAELRNWPWLDTLRTLTQRFREDHLGLTASSLTFTTLIALVPLATVTLALFSAFPMFARFQVALQEYLLQNLVPESIARQVLNALTQFAAKANRLGALGLIVLVITALALVFTIDRTLNAIWRVPKPRALAQRVLVYWAALTLGPLVLGVSLTVTSYAISASRGLVSAMPGGVAMLLGAIEFALLAAGMAALFRYVPNTHVRWVHAWAGALFVAIGIELAKRGLAWYLGMMPSYSIVYGAFAGVPILLLWIYLGWVIVLLGAVVAAYAPSLAMHVVHESDAPGQRFALSVAVLRELLRARADARHGLTIDDLAASLHVDPLQIEPLLQTLAGLKLTGRLDEDGAQRHLLLVDPATPAKPLINALLLADALRAPGFRRRAQLDTLTLADLIGD